MAETENTNANGEKRDTPAPLPLGSETRPGYEVPQDELPAQDPLKSTVPGTDASRLLDAPESPHIGREYVPGSASRYDGPKQ